MPRIDLFDVQLRQGRHISNERYIPDQFDAMMAFRLEIHPDDFANPMLTVRVGLQMIDNGKWRLINATSYTGRAPVARSGDPGFVVNGKEIAGQTIRIVADIPRPMRVGLYAQWR